MVGSELIKGNFADHNTQDVFGIRNHRDNLKARGVPLSTDIKTLTNQSLTMTLAWFITDGVANNDGKDEKKAKKAVGGIDQRPSRARKEA